MPSRPLERCARSYLTGSPPRQVKWSTWMAASTQWGNSGCAMTAMRRTRQLFLMRHAEAEFDGASDHERPLSMHGRVQARSVGQEMRAAGSIPGLVLCSSALRTRMTLDALLTQWEALEGSKPQVEVTDELYQVRPRHALEILNGLAGDPLSVLLIGHEPTISTRTALLASSDSDATALHTARAGFVSGALCSLDL